MKGGEKSARRAPMITLMLLITFAFLTTVVEQAQKATEKKEAPKAEHAKNQWRVYLSQTK
jgi:hypothetical protein